MENSSAKLAHNLLEKTIWLEKGHPIINIMLMQGRNVIILLQPLPKSGLTSRDIKKKTKTKQNWEEHFYGSKGFVQKRRRERKKEGREAAEEMVLESPFQQPCSSGMRRRRGRKELLAIKITIIHSSPLDPPQKKREEGTKQK